MGMNDMLRKMAVLLERRQDALFSYDVSKQKKYIAKLGNPRDEIERSYFQYKCQMQFNGKGITFLLNLVSFPVAILYDDRDDGVDPSNKEDNFGLIANDYSVKPALRVFQNLGHIAKDRKFSGFYSMKPSTMHAMRLDGQDESGKETVIVLWSDEAKSVTYVTVPLNGTAVDQYGEEVPVVTRGEKAYLRVSEEAGPVYLTVPE